MTETAVHIPVEVIDSDETVIKVAMPHWTEPASIEQMDFADQLADVRLENEAQKAAQALEQESAQENTDQAA